MATEPKIRTANYEHPAVATLHEIGNACVGCSDDLHAWEVDQAGKLRLFVRGPADGMIYEVTVAFVTIGDSHIG